MNERYDAFWAAYLGVHMSDWSRPGISIRPHEALDGYRGVWFFRHAARTVVSAPEGWVPFLTEAGLRDVDGERLLQEAFLHRLFGEDLDRCVGPSFHGSLDPSRFQRIGGDVRMLGPDDEQRIAALRRMCTDQDWDTSGLERASRYRAGHFEGRDLVSLAGYRPWSDQAGDLCVLTQPAHRGRGLGVRATSATIEAAVGESKLVLYQTLDSNVPAMRIAETLGFERYATNVAVRLRSDAPSTSRPPPRDSSPS